MDFNWGVFWAVLAALAIAGFVFALIMSSEIANCVRLLVEIKHELGHITSNTQKELRRPPNFIEP